MDTWEKVLLALIAVIAIPLVLFVIYVMLVYMPVGLYTEAKCLKQGYPKYAVSVGLERYCINLDGSVTVKVDKQ